MGYTAADKGLLEERDSPDVMPELWTDPALMKLFTREQRNMMGGNPPKNQAEFRFAQLALIRCDVKYTYDEPWSAPLTYSNMCDYFGKVASYDHKTGVMRTVRGETVWFRVSKPPKRDEPRLPYVPLEGINGGPGEYAAEAGDNKVLDVDDGANDADDEISRFSGSQGSGEIISISEDESLDISNYSVGSYSY